MRKPATMSARTRSRGEIRYPSIGGGPGRWALGVGRAPHRAAWKGYRALDARACILSSEMRPCGHLKGWKVRAPRLRLILGRKRTLAVVRCAWAARLSPFPGRGCAGMDRSRAFCARNAIAYAVCTRGVFLGSKARPGRAPRRPGGRISGLESPPRTRSPHGRISSPEVQDGSGHGRPPGRRISGRTIR